MASRHKPWISPSSNILVRWIASRQRTPLEITPSKNGTRKVSPPHIFGVCVQLRVFTLSRLAVNCPKTRIVSSLRPGVGSWNIRSCSLGTYVHDLWTHSFPESFLITKCALARRLFFRRLSALSINSISIFYEPFNYITWVSIIT